MQFKFAALLPIVALASGASAAECYAQDGSQTCVANDPLWSFREDYCTNNWQGNGNSNAYMPVPASARDSLALVPSILSRNVGIRPRTSSGSATAR
jgi:hypothetical protein